MIERFSTKFFDQRIYFKSFTKKPTVKVFRKKFCYQNSNQEFLEGKKEERLSESIGFPQEPLSTMEYGGLEKFELGT